MKTIGLCERTDSVLGGYLTASKIIENRDSFIYNCSLLTIVWFKEKDMCDV
jgi:hypothetical protein